MLGRHAIRLPDTGSRHLVRVRRHSVFRVIGLSALAVVLFGTSAVAAYIKALNSNIESYDVTDLLGGTNRPEDQASTQGDKSLLDPFAGRPVNLAVFGLDSREGENSRIASDAGDGGELNDVNMVVHIAADRQRVDVVSIPRDTLVDLPDCFQPDGQEHAGWQAMINAAYGHGSGGDPSMRREGVACVQRTFEAATGIRFDGYIMVDFIGFVGMVDAIGGVDMCLEEDFRGTGLVLELSAGAHHMDGRTALRYARTRHGYVGNQSLDGGDLGRISRQHQLMAAVAHGVLAQNSLSSLPALNSFAMALTSSLVVSPNLDSVTEMVGLAHSMRGIDMDSISMLTAPVVAASSDVNRLVFDEYGSSNTLGLTAEELFTLLARDQLVPGTVPWKLANPQPAYGSQMDSGAAQDSEGFSQDAAPGDERPFTSGGADTPGGAPNPDGKVVPDEGIRSVLDAPITCRS